MLDWARLQPGADRVTWVQGDAAAIDPTGTVDLVVCSGNTIMHLGPDELAAALDAITAALRPGGVLSFEARNPACREWERWTREETYGERDTHLGRLREWLELTDVTDGRVTFDAHNVLENGEDRVHRTILHFRDADDLTRALQHRGFGRITVDGGWRGEVPDPGARLLAFRAYRN